MNKQEKLTRFLLPFWHRIAAETPPGLVMELGVGGGASLNILCEVFAPRTVYGFDWFHGLPEAWGDKAQAGCFSNNGIAPVALPNGKIIEGLIQDTIPVFLKRFPELVGFVHFDMDLYSSTRYGLRMLQHRFQRGTILLFDEIAGEPAAVEHEEKAFREWLDTNPYDIELLGQKDEYSRVFKLV